MLERIKKIIEKDKLKAATICIAVLVFMTGIVMTLFNTGDTYADSISDYYCSSSGLEVMGTIIVVLMVFHIIMHLVMVSAELSVIIILLLQNLIVRV